MDIWMFRVLENLTEVKMAIIIAKTWVTYPQTVGQDHIMDIWVHIQLA